MDGQFTALQQGDNAQPGRVGKGAQRFYCAGHENKI
jgi:hypothetical protein